MCFTPKALKKGNRKDTALWNTAVDKFMLLLSVDLMLNTDLSTRAMQEADIARLSLNGKIALGRQLKVNWARPSSTVSSGKQQISCGTFYISCSIAGF